MTYFGLGEKIKLRKSVRDCHNTFRHNTMRRGSSKQKIACKIWLIKLAPK